MLKKVMYLHCNWAGAGSNLFNTLPSATVCCAYICAYLLKSSQEKRNCEMYSLINSCIIICEVRSNCRLSEVGRFMFSHLFNSRNMTFLGLPVALYALLTMLNVRVIQRIFNFSFAPLLPCLVRSTSRVMVAGIAMYE